MAQRVFATVGAGWTGALLYNNGDLVRELVSRLGSLTLQASSRVTAAPAGETAAIQALTLQMAQLTQLLSLQQASGRGAGSSRQQAVVLVSALGIATLSWSRLSNYLYVTRAQFRHGISTIGSTVSALGGALSRVKKALATQIDQVQASIDALSGRVDEVATGQAAIASELAGAREDIDGLTEAVNALSAKQAVTNTGVYYLCNAVRTAASKDLGLVPHMQELEAALASKKPLSTVESELEAISSLARTVQGL